MASEFNDCTDWTLVNDFTIHGKSRLSDRPYMVTRVPKLLNIELRDFQIAFSVRWTGGLEYEDEKSEDPHHEPSCQINARGILEDRISIFHMEKGVIAQFDQITRFDIHGIEKGRLGGKNNATSMTGIAYSGMSSREVPAKGLMEGEPGSLCYADERNSDYGPESERTEKLFAHLFIDQEAFDRLVNCLTKGYGEIERVHAQIVAELFQTEMDASLSESWMRQEYGIHIGDNESFAGTNARLEQISVVWKAMCTEQEPSEEPQSRRGSWFRTT